MQQNDATLGTFAEVVLLQNIFCEDLNLQKYTDTALREQRSVLDLMDLLDFLGFKDLKHLCWDSR